MVGALLASPAVAFGKSRLLLEDDTEFFVAPDGDDGNNGRSPETAWRRLQHGIDFLGRSVDFGKRNVVLNAAPGVYRECLKVYGAFVGQGAPESFTIRGSGPSSVISARGGVALNVLYGAHLYIEGFAVESDIGCFSAARSSELNFDEIEFWEGAGYHCHVGPHSSLRALGSYRICGSAGRHADCARGQFQINGRTQTEEQTFVTIGGKLTIPIFVNAIEQSLVDIAGPRFEYLPESSVLNGVGGARYSVNGWSQIYVGGAGPDYLPGDMPGLNDGTGAYG